MSLNRPELLFVSGPQDGERAMPASAQVIAGRSASADIFISEQSASRQQFQLTLTEDGWVFENLSSAGTKVNGKKCKAGKKLILGTGDVISAGGDTQILFVLQGDDPDQALHAYRDKHPQAAPPPPPPEEDKKAAGKDKPKAMPSFAPSRPPLPGEKSGAIVTRQSPAAPVVADLKPLTPFSSASSRPRAEATGPATGRLEKSPADARKAKLRKYAVMGLVYGLAMMGLIIILSTLRGGDESSEPEGLPAVMKADEIRDKLMDRPTVSYDPDRADAELRKGRSMRDNLLKPGDLYVCVTAYKLHLAYRSKSEFDQRADSRAYNELTKQLVDKVTAAYRKGHTEELAKRWEDAANTFLMIQYLVPDPENPIFTSSCAHYDYCRSLVKPKQ